MKSILKVASDTWRRKTLPFLSADEQAAYQALRHSKGLKPVKIRQVTADELAKHQMEAELARLAEDRKEESTRENANTGDRSEESEDDAPASSTPLGENIGERADEGLLGC